MKQGLHVAQDRATWSAAHALFSKGTHGQGLVMTIGFFRTRQGITIDPWPEESPL